MMNASMFKNLLTKSTTGLMVVLSLLAISLVGCNTVEGFGEDVEAAGDRIEDAAK